MWLHSSVGRASHRYRGGHGFESRWSPDFFQASSVQLLKLENLLRWSHFTFIYYRSTNMNYFIYISHDRSLSQSCTSCRRWTLGALQISHLWGSTPCLFLDWNRVWNDLFCLPSFEVVTLPFAVRNRTDTVAASEGVETRERFMQFWIQHSNDSWHIHV